MHRLLCSWNFAGKNTAVGCQFLLQWYKGDGKVQQSQSFEEKGALAEWSDGKLEPSASFGAWIQSSFSKYNF